MKEKLTILQINKFYYLKGGSERYLFDLSELLEQAGHKVIPFAMRDEKNWTSPYSGYFSEHMDLHRFSLKNILKIFYNWDAAKRLERLIQEEKPDIAHLHNINYQLSPAIIKVLKRHRVPMVMTLHDYNLICPNAKLFIKDKECARCKNGKFYHCFINKCSHASYGQSFLAMLEAYFNQGWRDAYDDVDLFIAPSQYMKDVCVKLGRPEKKIQVLFHFVKIKDNYAQAMPPEKYLLYFGRLSGEKGIDILLYALAKADKKIKLKIAGAGPDYQRLKGLINKFGLAGRVEILGVKNDKELPALIAGATAVIVPSIWPENMPFSALESLAMGKVVIASRLGGLEDIIKNGINGILFTSGDSNELADKINLVLTKSEMAKNIAETAREDSAKRFNPEKHYSRIIELYQGLIKF